MKNLFIDTNIYLTFYHYSSDDLEELKKLAIAIKSGNIQLYLTEQVRDEFNRNRESKIADALKRFKEQKLNNQFPQICKDYSEYQDLRKAVELFEKSKDKICEALQQDIEAKSFGADKLIDELFAKAKLLKRGEKVLGAAKLRMDVGNPPGKEGSYGDAVNWETLLDKTPHEDLHLITDDKDYISHLDENRLAEFLSEEWQGKKDAKIFFYRKISGFFKKEFPEIKLASEMEKDLAISRLANSGNFRTTHTAISALSSFSDFTNAQIKEITTAAVENRQIFWISEDPDVRAFMQSVIAGKESQVPPEILKQFKHHYIDQPAESAVPREDEQDL